MEWNADICDGARDAPLWKSALLAALIERGGDARRERVIAEIESDEGYKSMRSWAPAWRRCERERDAAWARQVPRPRRGRTGCERSRGCRSRVRPRRRDSRSRAETRKFKRGPTFEDAAVDLASTFTVRYWPDHHGHRFLLTCTASRCSRRRSLTTRRAHRWGCVWSSRIIIYVCEWRTRVKNCIIIRSNRLPWRIVAFVRFKR